MRRRATDYANVGTMEDKTIEEEEATTVEEIRKMTHRAQRRREEAEESSVDEWIRHIMATIRGAADDGKVTIIFSRYQPKRQVFCWGLWCSVEGRWLTTTLMEKIGKRLVDMGFTVVPVKDGISIGWL